MKKTRHTEEQIAFALKQAETGTSVAEVIRRMGISEQTFFRWKKVYGGLGVGELRRLKLLEPARRVSEHPLVPVARGRPSQDRGLAARLQREPSSHIAWLADAVEYAAAAAKIAAE